MKICCVILVSYLGRIWMTHRRPEVDPVPGIGCSRSIALSRVLGAMLVFWRVTRERVQSPRTRRIVAWSCSPTFANKNGSHKIKAKKVSVVFFKNFLSTGQHQPEGFSTTQRPKTTSRKNSTQDPRLGKLHSTELS